MSVIRGFKANKDFAALLFILSVSASLAYGYFNKVDRQYYPARIETQQQIMAGTASSPDQYRVLVPVIAQVFINAFSAVVSEKAAFYITYAIFDLLAIFFILAILFAWLKTWFTWEQSLIGVLFVAATMPIALQDHAFQPWSLLEVGLFTASLMAIRQNRYWTLAAMVSIASLNRETAVFIPVAFLLADLGSTNLFTKGVKINWKPFVIFCGLFLIWAATFIGLRYFLGQAPHAESLADLIALNTTKDSLINAVMNGSLFLGVIWVFAVFGYKHAPTFIKRVALVVPLYLLTVLVWGVWFEVRLLMPLYPILVPLGLSFAFRNAPEPSVV